MPYSVSELARLAGVSVRTLHHYDRIGLLEPSGRRPAGMSSAGYRYYEEEELLRLQQILLFRELEFPLEEIRRILDAEDFNPLAALEDHRRLLREKAARLERLLITVDKTIAHMGARSDESREVHSGFSGDEPRADPPGKERAMLSDKELYEGFDSSKVEEIKAEAASRWGHTEAYKESQRRVSAMSKADWARVKAEISAVESAVAEAFKRGVKPESREAMELMAQKAEQLRHFYEPNAELFRGLGEMYVADPRFTETYDKMAPGLAGWLKIAMAAFADRGMKL